MFCMVGGIAAAQPRSAPLEIPAPLAGGATLKTSTEQQQLLQHAAQSLAQGRADLAAILWQKVLDTADDLLTPASLAEALGPNASPLLTYVPLRERVEQIILDSPPEVLAIYRAAADPEALALLSAATPHDEQALAAVTRRFFLSSHGDDAALALASLALDRRDFVTAGTLLQKILERHPSSSLPKGQVLARLAIASIHLGDTAAAQQALQELATLVGTKIDAPTYDLLVNEVQTATASGRDSVQASAQSWLLPYGNSSRSAQMPPLPLQLTAATLAEAWSQDFPVASLSAGSTTGLPGGFFALDPFDERTDSPAQQAAAAQSRSEMIAQWRMHAWRPAGGLAFAGDRVYYKAPDRVVCYSSSPLPARLEWQSAWKNRYELDPVSRLLALRTPPPAESPAGNPALAPANARPLLPAEVLLFGDRVHPSLVISHDNVLSIEGRRQTTSVSTHDQRQRALSATPRRSRTNWLTAYQASGGKALWTRSAADDGTSDPGEIGFLAAPIRCGEQLLVPVANAGALWLYALSPDTGAIRWKTFLCDEPPSGASPWSIPQLAVEGKEVYIATGCGLVFAADGASGAIRWALRYPRHQSTAAKNRSSAIPEVSPQSLSGWDDDVVHIHGPLLLVLPSDCDSIFALDRRTGNRLWEAPRISPLGVAANYSLGIQGNSLYVAGRNVVRSYELTSGRLLAEHSFATSFGRGCLTTTAVYLPIGNSIWPLSLDLTPHQPPVSVVLNTDEPVGNLFSDGRTLWGVGASRFYALTPLTVRLAELTARVAQNDISAQFARARLNLQDGRLEEAQLDLQTAFSRLQSQMSPDAAARNLLATLTDLHLPQQHPGFVLRSLHSARGVIPPSHRLSPAVARHWAEAVSSGLNALRQQQPAGGVSDLLDSAGALTEDFLQTAASYTIDALAAPTDVPVILQALASADPAAQLLVIRAAVRLSPAEARPELSRLLQSPDERVRLTASRALANLGERQGVLESLVSLLAAESLTVRTRSYHTLQALTGQHIPFAPEGAASDRNSAAAAWRSWVQTHGRSAELQLPLIDRPARLGRILVSTPTALIEFDSSRNELWRTSLAGAAGGCQGLSTGHRLVAINSHSTVIEFDENGREVWRKDRLLAPPTSVQRLENNNTLIACPSARAAVEITPSGQATTLDLPGNPTWVERLDSGNTLAALESPLQRVIEIDASGRILWEARTAGHVPQHAVRLENGNTLVTLSKARQIVEFDPTGQAIVWRSQVPLLFPVAAQRLSNGNTLIADQTGLREVDVSGTKILWQHRVMQASGLSLY